MLKNKLRILQVNTGRIWSGAEEHMLCLGRGMQKRGHQVYFACPAGRETAANLHERGWKTIPLNSGITSLFRLVRIIKDFQIDIVHAHSGKDFTVCLLAAKLAGRGKVIFTRHIIKPLRQNIWNRWILKNTDRIIAVSGAVKQSLVDFNRVEPERITVIHNGLDLTRNRQVRRDETLLSYGLKSGELALSSIGRLDPEKGQRSLIKAMPLVLTKYPKTKLFLVGEDKNGGQEKEYLLNLVRENDLTGKVVFMGFQNDTAQILADSDLFVLASDAEPFGLVILEAMLQKVPIVAHGTGGVTEILEQGSTGILTSSNDCKTLAEGIIQALSDYPGAKERAERAYEVLMERFTLEKMLDETEKLYYSLNGQVI